MIDDDDVDLPNEELRHYEVTLRSAIVWANTFSISRLSHKPHDLRRNAKYRKSFEHGIHRCST